MRIIIGIMSLSMLFLVSAIVSCRTTDTGNDYAAPNQEAPSKNNSIDEQVEQLTSGERAPGEVIVRLREEMPLEEAYLIFLSHGFKPANVTKLEWVPQTYVLSFSEDERDIKSVVKKFLLDTRVLDVSANFAFETADNESD